MSTQYCMLCHIYIISYVCSSFMKRKELDVNFVYAYECMYHTYAYPEHTHSVCVSVCAYKWPVLDDIFGRMVADIALDSSQNK